MSVTIGTIAGSTGLGSERQIIQTVTGDLWAFQYTGTNVLSTWVSQNAGVSWTTGNTHTLTNAHNSEGRNLAVAYRRIAGVDVVHISLPSKSGTNIQQNEIRATIAGTTITFHTSESSLAVGTPDGDSLFWTGSGLDFDSNNKLHLSSGWTAGGNGDINSSDSTADAGSAEQMTPITWSSHVIDSSITAEMRSAYVVDLGSGKAAIIADNGDSAAGLTGLNFETWNGSAWTFDINQLVTGGTFTSINKNDWGAVELSPTDIHVVYRDSSGDLIHRRYNGTNWTNGQTIPPQSTTSGTGVALATDGDSVWLTVLSSNAANAVRFIRWTSLAFNDVADQWETWGDAEGSSQTRTFVGCVRDVVNQNLLIYWTEGTNFVTVAVAAVSPPDPPGIITRDATSALGSSAGSATITVAFTGTQPIAGDKIVVGFWASFGSTPSITSVKDNANVQNTFTAGPNNISATSQGVWIYWLDLPANATWTGNYTITVTLGASVSEFDGGALAYGNVQSGAPIATNNNSGSASPATTGSVNSPSGNSLYFAAVTDSTGANPATFTWAAPFSNRVSQTNGSTQQAGAVGDVINQSGSQNASITIDAFPWNAAIAVWPGAPSQINTSPINPGQTWRRRYWKGLTHPVPGVLTGSTTISNIVTATDNLSAMSDTASRASMGFLRTATDTLSALSDTATRILSLPRAVSDSLGALSETILQTLSLPRTVVDNLASLSDTATRASQSFLRSATDNLSVLSDTGTRAAQSFSRTTTDNLSSTSDTPTRILSLPRTVTDNLSSMSDTATRAAMAFTRTATDNLSNLSDTATRAAQSFIRTATDTLSAMSDTASALKVIIRTATDNLSAMSDTATRAAQSFLRSPSDSLASLSETVSRLVSLPRSLSENLSALSETLTRLLSLPRTATDSLPALSEQTTRLLGLVRSVQDFLPSLSDTPTRAAQTFVRSAIDNLVNIVDSAINASSLVQLFATLTTRARDSSLTLMKRVRDGSLVSRVRDGSLVDKVRDGTMRVFGRDSSLRGKERG